MRIRVTHMKFLCCNGKLQLLSLPIMMENSAQMMLVTTYNFHKIFQRNPTPQETSLPDTPLVPKREPPPDITPVLKRKHKHITVLRQLYSAITSPLFEISYFTVAESGSLTVPPPKTKLANNFAPFQLKMSLRRVRGEAHLGEINMIYRIWRENTKQIIIAPF